MGFETESDAMAPSRRSPLLIWGPEDSWCCRARTLFVRSKPGGFVSLDCFKCGGFVSYVSLETFRKLDVTIACGQCAKPMLRVQFSDRNYGFVCDSCERSKKFADVLPYYKEIQR